MAIIIIMLSIFFTENLNAQTSECCKIEISTKKSHCFVNLDNFCPIPDEPLPGPDENDNTSLIGPIGNNSSSFGTVNNGPTGVLPCPTKNIIVKVNEVPIDLKGICSLEDILANEMIQSDKRQICFKGKFRFWNTIKLEKGDVFYLDDGTIFDYKGCEEAFSFNGVNGGGANGGGVIGSGNATINTSCNSASAFKITDNGNNSHNSHNIISGLSLNHTGANSSSPAIYIENESDYGCNDSKIVCTDLKSQSYFNRISDLKIRGYNIGIRLVDEANANMIREIELINIGQYGIYMTGCQDNSFTDIEVLCENASGVKIDCSTMEAVIRLDAHLLPVTSANECICNFTDDICHLSRPIYSSFRNIVISSCLSTPAEYVMIENLPNTIFSNNGHVCTCPVPTTYIYHAFKNWFHPVKVEIELLSDCQNISKTPPFDTVPPYQNSYANNPIEVIEPCGSDKRDITSSEKIISTYQVYPNPAGNKLNIVPPYSDKEYSYKLFDVYGKCIADIVSIKNHQEINTSQFTNGIYTLLISSESNRESVKVIIMNQ